MPRWESFYNDKDRYECSIESCEYYSPISEGCDYRNLMGTERPCPAGKKCHFSPVEPKGKAPTTHEERRKRRLEMYNAGMSIYEISKREKVKSSDLRVWFARLGITVERKIL